MTGCKGHNCTASRGDCFNSEYCSYECAKKDMFFVLGDLLTFPLPIYTRLRLPKLSETWIWSINREKAPMSLSS